MLKYIFFISAIFITTSCSLSGENKETIVINNTTPVVITGSIISSWQTSSGYTIWASGELLSSPPKVSPGTEKMINIQKQKWEDGILAADCKSLPDKEWRDFCMSQQNKLQETIKNTVTWEWSIKKWWEFISTMDCTTIYSDVGQKYCQEYQAGLKKK